MGVTPSLKYGRDEAPRQFSLGSVARYPIYADVRDSDNTSRHTP